MILLVEDDAALADTCFALLQLHGYEVSFARSAEDALKQLGWFTPELILTDWLMPGMDGIEFARHCRANDALRTTPIILMSGSLPGLASKGPFDRFLPKPFLAETLMAEISALLAFSSAPAAFEVRRRQAC